MDCEAIIIAGGKGTRLSKYTNEIPKPMIPIAGMPVLEHQIRELSRTGIKKIYITVGHLKEVIMDYFRDGRDFGVDIEYAVENSPLGTCGVFYCFREKINKPVVIVYGDVLFSMDLDRMYRFHREHQAEVSLAVHPNSHPYDSDLVVCDAESRVIAFDKKENAVNRAYYHNLVNAGVFFADASILKEFHQAEKKDFEKDLLMPLIRKGRVYAYRTTEYIKDMGTYQRLNEVDGYIRSGQLESRNLRNKQKCIFLDRDGTINKLNGLIYTCGQMEIEDGAAEAIRIWNQNNYLCIVITNQPVIARNLCTFRRTGSD